MNAIDVATLLFFNTFARESAIFDDLVVMVADNDLLKGGLVMAVLWWFWVDRQAAASAQTRARILATLAGAFVAVAMARMLALVLPFRMRPLHHAGALGFVVPLGQFEGSLDGWSSLPSDHAALFFALATGLVFVSRRIGIIALVYALAVIAWPRVYVGLHYPSDVLVGGILGVGLGIAANAWLPRSRLVAWGVSLAEACPGAFYAAMFLVTFQVATLFDGVRAMGRVAGPAAARALPHAGGVAAVATFALVAIAALAIALRRSRRRHPTPGATRRLNPAVVSR